MPIYTNIDYPFPKNPPYIPHEYNPVGSYRTTFTIPENWKDKQICIHFGAVRSAFYVWVNGKKVGYSQGSKLPAEFDITDYLKEGENVLAVEVYRWSDGSYLEDQDFWRLSGIEREVYLFAKNPIHIADVNINAAPMRRGDGYLLTQIFLENNTNQPLENYELSLHFHDDKLVKFNRTQYLNFPVNHDYTRPVVLPQVVFKVDNWTAEMPKLYTLVVKLKNDKGKLIEATSFRVGFRTVEIDDGVFKINGQKVKLKGVNHHDHHCKSGHVVNRGMLLQDMRLMKAANINAIRCSHYPKDPFFYELCVMKWGFM